MTELKSKLKFTELLETTAKEEKDLDLTVISELFNVSSHQLRVWADQWAKDSSNEVNLEAMLYETTPIDTEEVHINPVTGMVELLPQGDERQVIPVESFRNGLTGLNLLSLELQAAAGAITNKVQKTIKDPDLSAPELYRLAGSIATLQNAFFNSATTNIQVNTGGGESESLLTKFQEHRKA